MVAATFLIFNKTHERARGAVFLGIQHNQCVTKCSYGPVLDAHIDHNKRQKPG